MSRSPPSAWTKIPTDSTTLLSLRLAEGVAAASTPAAGEYRALVCLFLAGGNDSYNMLVPREPSAYAAYQASRADLALTPAQLIDIHPVGLPDFAVHGGMPEVAGLFGSSQAAFVANVGTLIEPVLNRAQVEQNLKRLPLGLYSHSDQLEQQYTNILAQTFNARKKQALDAYHIFATATAAPLPAAVTFPNTYVGQRLAMNSSPSSPSGSA